MNAAKGEASQYEMISKTVFSILLALTFSFCESQEREVPSATDLYLVVQKVLKDHDIDIKSVRKREIRSTDGTFIRFEQKVTVAPVFNFLQLNHDLSRAIADLGATAIATERSEDKTVAIHIKRDGVVVQSIIFVLKKESR